MLTHDMVATDLIVFQTDGTGVFTLSEGPGLVAIGSASGKDVGKTLEDVVDDPRVPELLCRALAGEPIEHVTVVRGRTVETIVTPTHDKAGRVDGLAGAARVRREETGVSGDQHYRIRVTGESFGEVVTSEPHASAPGSPRCYERWSPDGHRCDGCPAAEPLQSSTVGVVRTEAGSYRVVTATAPRNGVVTLHAHVITEEVLSKLMETRIRGYAASAKLTAREREVLELRLLGRSLGDIGVGLGIQERTAKFHTRNALRKLGAESTQDLLRILLKGIAPLSSYHRDRLM